MTSAKGQTKLLLDGSEVRNALTSQKLPMLGLFFANADFTTNSRPDSCKHM